MKECWYDDIDDCDYYDGDDGDDHLVNSNEDELGLLEDDELDSEDFDIDFADPGGNSALRAASKSNPRNLPCPSCKRKNMLTPKDRARGYQCDHCADQAECGF